MRDGWENLPVKKNAKPLTMDACGAEFARGGLNHNEEDCLQLSKAARSGCT